MGGVNWADLVALMVLGWGAFRGFQQGFLRTFLLAAGYLGAAALAARYSFPVVERLDQKAGLVTSLRELLERYLPLPASLQVQGITPAQFTDPTPWLNRLPLPPAFMEWVGRYAASAGHLLPGGITGARTVYHLLATWVLGSLAFLLMFWAGRVMVNLLVGVLGRAVRLTPLGALDRGAGLLAGLLYSGAILAVAFGLLAPLAAVGGAGPITGSLQGSRAAAYFGQLFLWLTTALWRGQKP